MIDQIKRLELSYTTNKLFKYFLDLFQFDAFLDLFETCSLKTIQTFFTEKLLHLIFNFLFSCRIFNI